MLKNSCYFDHDYSARNDQKILRLRAKYGLEGYGFFWCVIESMAEDSTGFLDGTGMAELSLSYGISIEKVTEMMSFLIDIKLIEKCGHGNLFNKRILEHKRFRSERVASGKKGAANRWNNQQVDSSANSSANSIKVKYSKVKKENNTFIPPPFDEFNAYCKEKGFSGIARRAFDGYEAGDWHDAHGQKILRWKQKLINGWFTDKNKDKAANAPTGKPWC